MEKSFVCPHCSQRNAVADEKTWEYKLEEMLPESLVKVFFTTGMDVAGRKLFNDQGATGLIAGGAVLVDSIVKFYNGTEVVCGNCGRSSHAIPT